jgi:hypothetical protein
LQRRLRLRARLHDGERGVVPQRHRVNGMSGEGHLRPKVDHDQDVILRGEQF